MSNITNGPALMPMLPNELAALERAIACFDTQAEFAAALTAASGESFTKQAVSWWKNNGLPVDRCELVEFVTEGKVRVEDVRSDIQWQRDATGRVIGYLPAPVPITPTKRRRPAKARA